MKRKRLIEELRCFADLWINGWCPPELEWPDAYMEVDKLLIDPAINPSGSMIAYAALEMAARLEEDHEA